MNLSALINLDLGLFLLRLVVAIIFIYHGLPKLMKAKMMGQGMGAPAAAVFLLGLVEIVSSVGLIAGFWVQGSALLLAIVMVGAIGFKIKKWKMPFSAMDKTGWEFDLILLAANLAILFTAGGGYGLVR